MSGTADLARALAAAPEGTQVLAGTVVSRAGALAVNVAGTYPPVRWAPGWVPAVGDNVRVLAFAGEYLVLGRVLTAARPATGTVTATGTPRCTVSAGGVTYSCLRNAAYTPVVGHVVRLDWSEPVPWIIGQSTIDTPPATDDPTVPPPPPALSDTGESTFAAIDSGRWSTAYGWDSTYNGRLQQGTSGGTNTGAWFYGTAPRATLAGRTITRAWVWVHRSPNHGPGGAAAVHLYRHGSDTRPAGNVALAAGPSDVSRARGQAEWAEIPAAWGQAIATSGGGLGISGDPYLMLEGLPQDGQSGALRLAWAR